jgi:uncharacterized membrane protein YvbJ
MGLISCPECGAQVSERAVSCPKCGHPIAKPVPQKESLLTQVLNVGWMAIVIAMAIIGLFALIGTCKWRPV